MGSFALIINAAPDDTRVGTARAAMEKRGFAVTDRLEAGPHVLLLAPSMIAAEPCLVRDGGNFAASSGTLFYKGLYGEEALKTLLQSDDIPARDDVSGCGAFLIFRNGTLTVFTDPLGTYKVYRDRDDRIWSDSFMAVAAAVEKPSINPQGIYEYVFQGATYGNETVLNQISLLDSNRIHRLNGTITSEIWPGRIEPRIRDRPMAEHVEAVAALLKDRYRALAKAFGTRIDTALSGGYDSRLTLALLLDQGVTPHLHVYGRETDPDVVVAKVVCAGEGLNISHEDKSRIGGDNSPDAVAEATARQFHAFDGWPVDGVIGNGSDLATRQARCKYGVLALNGGGGEIFRNFFYLPDCRYSVRQMLWTFYSQFEPRWCTGQFDEQSYHARLSRKVAGLFDQPADLLNRAEVEYIYPAFRGRFWTGRNTAINTHMGPALTPFLDHAVVRHAVTLPLSQKNHGQFEGALIKAISPTLAGYMSDYGHDFASPVPARRKIKDWMTYLRPPALRRVSFRMKMRLRPPTLPPYLLGDHRAAYLPDGVQIMGRFFDIDAVREPGQMNRILTLEMLFQHLNARAGITGEKIPAMSLKG